VNEVSEHKFVGRINPERQENRPRPRGVKKQGFFVQNNQSVFRLFQRSFITLTQNFLLYAKFVCLVFVPLVVLDILMPGLAAFVLSLNQENIFFFRSVQVVFWIFMITISLLAAAFYFLGCVFLSDMLRQGRTPALPALIKKIFSDMGNFFAITVLVVFKVFLWSLLLIIPGMIFSVLYAFSSFAAVLDRKKGYEALVFSRKIIQPNIFAYLPGIVLAGGLFVGVFFLGDRGLAAVFGVRALGDRGILPVIGEILFYFINIFASVYVFIFLYHLYDELKARVTLN
jgi:hypothetical protein